MPPAQQHESPPTQRQPRPAVETARGKTQRDQVLRDEAWIGDAVLALYARLKILREDGTLDGEKAVRMSSNQFLAALGEPTAVEAAIGRVFEREGLEAAFAHIERVIMPLFGKQEEKRQRKSGQPVKVR
jgi:dsRNA-specific ribonuclease